MQPGIDGAGRKNYGCPDDFGIKDMKIYFIILKIPQDCSFLKRLLIPPE